ncbi:MAG: hypothetical protein V4498_05555 [candidate division FCPU426 bacterium]
MGFIKKNITLIVGISIPILMILFVAASIYLPGFFIHPKYNFLYATGYDIASCSPCLYSVENHKLVRNTINPSKGKSRPDQGDWRLHICDVAKNESKEISFEEARKLDLDPRQRSPDGFEVTYGSRSDGFPPFFFESTWDYNNPYLKGHNLNKRLNLQVSPSYRVNFRVIGWIK